MRMTLNIDLPNDHPDERATRSFLEMVAETVRNYTGATFTFDRTQPVSLLRDAVGTSTVWGVMVGEGPAWSYASGDGPPPDALELWNALAEYLPMYEPEGT